MQKRKLGKSNLEVSAIGSGAWEFRIPVSTRQAAAKSAKRALAAPFSDFQSLIVLVVDPPQSLRGPNSIYRPFSHTRGWILPVAVPSFRPCPG
jgi:hypothetical protein